MNIYLLSGLGADKRVFSRVAFSANHVVRHIEWISPISNEGLSSYARRLSGQIDEAQPFCWVGISFGGVVAVELNKFVKPLQTIIISSAWTDVQIPWYYKVYFHQSLRDILNGNSTPRFLDLFVISLY